MIRGKRQTFLFMALFVYCKRVCYTTFPRPCVLIQNVTESVRYFDKKNPACFINSIRNPHPHHPFTCFCETDIFLKSTYGKTKPIK